MKSSLPDKIFLFSIDLEDVRLRMVGGEAYKDRIPFTTRTYLNWLNKNKLKCTFFIVGDVAEKHPSLINEIAAERHEIASHSYKHIPLDKQTPVEFRMDLENSKRILLSAGAKKITGFRAPNFSLIEETQWAYEILAESGFVYSSSVFPAKNPLYSWKEFGKKPKRINEKIIEIPMTVGKIGLWEVPFGGGIYFRLLPNFILMYKTKKYNSADNPLLGYFHPYDIDTGQEQFMHPGIKNNWFYNRLMYFNRHRVFERLDNLLDSGFTVCTYQNYIANHLSL